MSTTITGFWKVLSLIVIVAFVVLVARFVYHETRIPQNQGEVLNRMIELQKEGRYDKAVQVVQNWMNDGRRDISHDGFMYGQIAMVYIMKAYKRPTARDQSVRRAEENLQKALSFFDGRSQSDLSLDPFEIGGGYEILADISDKDKCRLYEKARALFVRQLPLIREIRTQPTGTQPSWSRSAVTLESISSRSSKNPRRPVAQRTRKS
jgi:hypothetical protein